MKNGFTFVELIFVIVILGILAAVAIPKLSATRDDAKNAVLAQNIMTGAGEVASYALSKGSTLSDLKLMSHAFSSLVSSGDATSDPLARSVDIIRGNVNDCAKVSVSMGTNEENLTVSLGSAGSDTRCLGLQQLIDVTIYPMVLKGKQVEY